MLYEVDVFQGYFGNSCLNTFNYMSTGTPAAVTGSFALMSALGFIPAVGSPTILIAGTLAGAWQSMVAVPLTFLSVQVKAIYDPTDFYELPYPTSPIGLISGEGMPPTNAFGFRSSIVNRLIGRGMKRFAGIAEPVSGPGGIIGPGFVADEMTTMANRLGEVITYTDEGNTLSFTPCVVSKEKYHPEGKTTWAYRYYSTLTLQTPHVASGITWQPYTQVRTQVSRQYGRGA